MNCLKCENFWSTDIDESKCDCCHCQEKKEGRNLNESAHSLPG